MRNESHRGLRELLLAALGFFAFTCRDCSHRFLDRPYDIASVVHAKCPRCFRMDLTIWDPSKYHTSWIQDVSLWLGAHAWRCDPCRTNFVSWRPRRSRYIRPTPPVVASSASQSKARHR